MPIINDPSSNFKPALKPKPVQSTLGSAYQLLGFLTLLGACVAMFYGSIKGDIQLVITGCGCVLGAILLFGIAEFFNQIARIASATEETARLLRERPPV